MRRSGSTKKRWRTYPRTCPKVASKPATAKTFARRSSHGAAWSDPAVWAKETARLMGGGVDPADWLMEPRPGSRHARAIDDLFAYEQVYGIYSRHVAEGHAELKPRLALLTFEKALVHETAGDIAGAMVHLDRAIALYESLTARQGDRSCREALIRCCVTRALVWNGLARYRSALESFDRGISLWQRLHTEKGPAPDNNSLLAESCQGKALTLTRMGEFSLAVEWYDRAIEILGGSAGASAGDDCLEDLAMAYHGKAVATAMQGPLSRWQSFWTPGKHFQEAIALYDEAMELYNRPAKQEALGHRSLERAKCLADKAGAQAGLGDFRQAIQSYGYAVASLQQLTDRHVERELAICFMNQAILVGETEGELAAVGRYDRALETFERLVRRAGRRECTHELAICSMNKGCALAGLGNDTDAMILLDRAIQILEQEVREDARSSLREDLALCLMNRAIPFGRRGQVATAQSLFQRALQACDALAREGREGARDDVGLCLMNLGTLLWRSGRKREAIRTYNRAIAALGFLSRGGHSPKLSIDLAFCYLNKAMALHLLGRGWFAARCSAGQAGHWPAYRVKTAAIRSHIRCSSR